MLEKGNFKKEERTHAEIVNYQQFMQGTVDEIEHNGVIFKSNGSMEIVEIRPSIRVERKLSVL